MQVMALPTSGLELQALVSGPPDGIPVLALHGWLDNAASFSRLAPFLTHCRVVAVDQRGHGQSPHTHQPYDIWDGVADVFGCLEALQWDRAIVLGHSMGAAVGTLFASAFPERVRHLWLIEGLGPWPDMELSTAMRLRRAVLGAAKLTGRPKRVFETLEAAIQARVMGAVSPITYAAAEPIVRRGVVRCEGGFVWSSDAYLTLPSMVRLAEGEIQNCLQQLSMPVSLALGDAGILNSAEFLSDRVAICPDLRVETFAGGHHLHLEGAERALAKWFEATLECA